MPDFSKEYPKSWNSNWIELLAREDIVGDNAYVAPHGTRGEGIMDLTTTVLIS